MKRLILSALMLVMLLLPACQPTAPSPTLAPTLPAPTHTSAPATATLPPLLPSVTVSPSPSPTLTTEPTLAGAQVLVVVDQAHALQTLQTVSGGNFINKFHQANTPLDPVSTYNLDHLPMKVARIRMSLEDWEPQNDDNDPGHFNLPAFQDSGDNHNTFLLMQDLQRRGIAIIATAWDIPAWMTPNSTAKANKFIPYDLYPEVVESIAAWLVHARDQYGVNVSYVSFNEPNIGVNVSLASFEYPKMIQIAGPRFTELGLTTRWLIGDTSNMDGSTLYAEPILSTATIRPYLGPLAVHSWDANASDDVLQGIGDFAAKEGLEVWSTETGWDPFLYTHPEDFPTWNNAIHLAIIYSRLLKLTRASVILYWEMMGNDYYLNDGSHPFPAFDILQQLGDNLPAGTRILSTSPNAGGVFSFAADASGRIVLYLVNSNTQSVKVQINSLPAGSYAHIQSTAQETGKSMQAASVTSAPVILELAASSVNLYLSSTP